MEIIEIVLAALAFFQTTFIAWGVWVTQSIAKLDKSISLNDQKDTNVMAMISDLSGKIEAMAADVKGIQRALDKNGIETP